MCCKPYCLFTAMHSALHTMTYTIDVFRASLVPSICQFLTAAINYALHFSINIIFLICRWFSISITLKPRCFLVLWKLLICLEQMRKRNKSGPISSWNRITMIFYQTKSETKQMVRWIKLRFVLITYVCQICSVNQSVDLSLLIFIMR